MPSYSYRCWACGDTAVLSRTVATRDNVTLCRCGAWKRRQIDATAGVIRSDPVRRPGGPDPQDRSPRVPGVTITNCEIVNCGTGIRMDGGHAVVRGLRVLETPVAFELNRGATVDGADIVHRAPSAAGRSKRGRRSS